MLFRSARSLGALSFLAAQTSLRTQTWHSVTGQISLSTSAPRVGTPMTLKMQVPGLDLSSARITWETAGREPCFGQNCTFAPNSTGALAVQAEAQLPDGRRVFARTTINVTN